MVTVAVPLTRIASPFYGRWGREVQLSFDRVNSPDAALHDFRVVVCDGLLEEVGVDPTNVLKRLAGAEVLRQSHVCPHPPTREVEPLLVRGRSDIEDLTVPLGRGRYSWKPCLDRLQRPKSRMEGTVALSARSRGEFSSMGTPAVRPGLHQ